VEWNLSSEVGSYTSTNGKRSDVKMNRRLTAAFVIMLFMVGIAAIPVSSKIGGFESAYAPPPPDAPRKQGPRIFYEGIRDENPVSVNLLPGQSVTFKVPKPPTVEGNPDAWRLSSGGSGYPAVTVSGINIDGHKPTVEQLIATLIPSGAHLQSYGQEQRWPIGAEVDLATYINSANLAPGDPITFTNKPGSEVTFTGTITCQYTYRLYPEDQSNVYYVEMDSDTRVVCVTLSDLTRFDPGFGTSNAFFNNKFGYYLHYYGLGRCLPQEIVTPDGRGVLETFRVKRSAVSRYFRLRSTQTRLSVSHRASMRGFKELGYTVEGTWMHYLKVVDPNHPLDASPIPPPGKVDVWLFNDLEMLHSIDLTLTPGQPFTLPARPDLRGRKWYPDMGEVYLESIDPMGSVESITVSDAVASGGFLYPKYHDNIWFTYGDRPIVKNIGDQTVAVRVTDTAIYRADATQIPSVAVSDVATGPIDGYIRHEVSLTLPGNVPDSDLGFNRNTGLLIDERTFGWKVESFKTPSGDSVDDPRFRGAYREFLNEPYQECCTIAAYYYARQVQAYHMYAFETVNPTGTWRLTLLEPVLALRYTITGGDLLVTDPQGRRIGFNGVEVVNTIGPLASYQKEASGVETIVIYGCLPVGEYRLEASASSSQIIIDIEVAEGTQTLWSQHVTALTTPGIVTAFSTAFNVQDGYPQAPTQQQKLDYTLAWLPPITVKDWYKADQTIPIKFDVRDKDGSFVHDETVKIRVYGLSGYFKEFQYSATPSDTTIRILDAEKMYIVNWHLSDISTLGHYAIRVYFRDILLAQTILSVR